MTVSPSPLNIDLSYCDNPIIPPQASARSFGYLQRSGIFHTLNQLVPLSYSSFWIEPVTDQDLQDLPPVFRAPPFLPDASLSSSDLLLSSNFRSAAIAAANELINGTNLSAPEIFSLFYIRLACLTLIDATAFAAEESKALDDLNSPIYRDDNTKQNLLPWELQILAVRLQGIGYHDPRRAIAGYYDLARDARENITKTSVENRIVWKERLGDLGLRVGNALVEMGDVSGAIRHLKSLCTDKKTTENNEVWISRLALLYMRLGALTAANSCIEATTCTNHEPILQPLLSMAEGRYEDAISEWRNLLASSSSTMATQNLAVCLLYVGRIEEVI